MGSQSGFIILFSALGFVTSTICGFWVGNRISHILFVSTIGTLSFSGLGVGVYNVLQKKVPEFLEMLQNLQFAGGGEGEGAEGSLGDFPESGGEFHADMGDSAFPTDETPVKKKRNDKFGDHLVIDNIEIKNEPKLMAEAIRTMLARDEEG